MNKQKSTHRIITACLLSGILCVLSGCGNTGSSASPTKVNNESDIVPNIISFGANYDEFGSIGEHYGYIVDRNTGVVYLSYDAYRRHAITVMLNADGTPVTAEQLGLKY